MKQLNSKQTRKNKYAILDDKARINSYYIFNKSVYWSNRPQCKVLNLFELDGAARKTPYFKKLLKYAARRKQFKIL